MSLPDILKVKYRDTKGLFDCILETDKIDVSENGPNPEQDRYYLTSEDVILKRPAFNTLEKMYKYGKDGDGFAIWWIECETKEIINGKSTLGRVIWLPEQQVREFRLRDIDRFDHRGAGHFWGDTVRRLYNSLDAEKKALFDSIIEDAVSEYMAYHDTFPALDPVHPLETFEDKVKTCFYQGKIDFYSGRVRGKYFAFWKYDDFIYGYNCVLLFVLLSMTESITHNKRGVFCLFVDQSEIKDSFFDKTKEIVSDLRSKVKILNRLFPDYRIRIYHVVFCGGEYRFWNERTERFRDVETGEIWERKLFVYKRDDYYYKWVQGEPRVIRPISNVYDEEIKEDKKYLKTFNERVYYSYKGMTLFMLHMSFYKLDKEKRLWVYIYIYEGMFIDNINDFVEIIPNPEWEDYEVI